MCVVVPPVPAITENPLLNVLLCASGLVTVTFRAPVVAVPEIVMLAVSCVALLNAHEVTVIPVPKLHVAPLWKLLPPSTTLNACPCTPLFGVALVKLGGGSVACVTCTNFATDGTPELLSKNSM